MSITCFLSHVESREEKDDKKVQEELTGEGKGCRWWGRVTGKVDMTKACYMYMWKCHNETHDFVQLICTNNYKKGKKKQEEEEKEKKGRRRGRRERGRRKRKKKEKEN